MKRVKESSGNVFRDLGLPDPGDLLAKAELSRQLHEAIKRKGLTQMAAAKLLGLRQPDVSKLMAGRLPGFSTDRLMRSLTRLGRDVQITVKAPSKAGDKGRVTVVAM